MAPKALRFTHGHALNDKSINFCVRGRLLFLRKQLKKEVGSLYRKEQVTRTLQHNMQISISMSLRPSLPQPLNTSGQMMQMSFNTREAWQPKLHQNMAACMQEGLGLPTMRWKTWRSKL